MADIESLELRITSDSNDAKAGLDALITTLDTLKTKTKGGVGLTSVANQVGNLARAAGTLNGSEGAKLESLAKGLNALSGLGALKISSSIANQVSSMGTAIKSLDGVDYSKLSGLSMAVQPLTTLGKSNLGPVLNQIKKLPEVMTELGKVDMGAFAAKIKELTASLKPLADEMQKVANGFSAFPAKIQQFLNSSSKVPSANTSSGKSFANLAARVTATIYAFKRGATVIASWINKSSEYTENQNLFTVAMGQYARSAMEYANTVSEAMGIDTSDWIRNQGVFMTLATGFGSVGDRAATMSKQLTQLGYDLSSYYNITVEEAMQKLKSGFAGELEPLRNLGYDLSQAKLEAVALSLGIDKAVSSMTQAEKAELRYYAIMTQVTQVQGDMARTLEAPANQLRILTAQAQMAARALGNIFIPALNAVLPYVIAAVKVIRLLANAIASLVGFTMPEVDYSSFSDAGSGAEQISAGLGEAAGNAAKLKKTLLGIDELNVLPDSSGGSGGADVGGGAGFDFDLPTYDFIGEATNNRVNEIVEKMKEWLGLTGEIKSWSDLFNTNLGQILLLVGEIGAGLLLWKLSTGLLKGVKQLKDLKKAGLTTPMTIMAGATLAITGFAIEFTGVSDAIKNGLDGLNFGEILAGGLLGTGGAALLGKGIGDFIAKAFSKSAVAKAITAGGGTISTGLLGAAIGGIVAGIPMFVTGVYDAIMNGLNWLNSILVPAGATLTGAGIGAIIGMLGGPIGAGIGALIGLAVGLVTDLVILIVQNWEEITAWCSQACTKIGEFFSDLWDDIKSVWNKVSKWFNTKVIKPVVDFFKNLWTSVSEFFSNLWDDIVSIFEDVSKWFDTKVIKPVVDFFTEMWTKISNAASACWDAIVTFFTPAVKWFSALFNSIRQTISDIFYNIGVIASGCWEIIKAVWVLVSAWFDTNVIQPVKKFFTQLWSAISTAAVNAWNSIKSVFATIGDWISKYVIQPVSAFFTNLWNGIKTAAIKAWEGIKSTYASVTNWIDTTIIRPVSTFFTNLWNGIKTAAISAWNGIQSVYASVTNWIDTTIIRPVSTFFSNLWGGFINGAKGAWEGVKTVFSTVASFFSTTFQDAWNGIVNIFSVSSGIFTDIKDGIVTAFKSVVNGLITGINNVVSVPFKAINNALFAIKYMKILGLYPFLNLKLITVPTIPLLAEGGVVDAGQMFIARESGPELVGSVGNRTAVVNNEQIVSAVSKGVYQAVVQAMAQNGDQTVEAKVNDKVLFEVILNRNRQETMRKGFNPLMGGV